MLDFVKWFFTFVLGMIASVVLWTLETTTYILVYITKGARWLYLRVHWLISGADIKNELDALVNWQVNYTYKSVIDKAYPTKDEES